MSRNKLKTKKKTKYDRVVL